MASDPTVALVEYDISRDFEEAARAAGVTGWDLETTGLDWATDRIGTCQVYVPGRGVEIVQIGERKPQRLVNLLSSADVTKVFHHAAFDLRFMRFNWGMQPASIHCTKILAKIALPRREPRAYSLKPLVAEFIGANLDKSLQVSDWTSESLTAEQLTYAARDVLHLIDLRDALLQVAEEQRVLDLVASSFAYLPTRVETDLRRCGDVFAY